MPSLLRLALLVWLAPASLAFAGEPSAAKGSEPSGAKNSRAPHRASARAIAQYLRARLADSARDHAAAVEALRLALAYDPDSPQLHLSYADALARFGQGERAEAEARRALELAPSGPAAVDAHLVLGKILALAGRTAPARHELEVASELEGARVRAVGAASDGEDLDPEPWRALARVDLEAGDAAGASDACEKLAEFDPPEAAAGLREVASRLYEAHDAERAAATLARAVELAPSEPEGFKLLAQVEEGRGHFPEARQAWERALSADPDDPDTLLAAGQLAERQGDLTAARTFFRHLFRSAPDETAARARVAALWLDAKQPGDALEVAQGSDEPQLVYLRGVALQQMKRWEDAAAVFARVKPSSPELYASARVSLAYVLERAGRPADAVKAVRRGLETSPKDPALLFALGEAYERAGQRELALEQMRAVLAVKADHAEALNFIGYSYAERGEHLDEAQALVERALRLEPDNGYYLDSLGWVLYKRGDLERAVKALERADELVGPEATILEHLGDTYRAAARTSDAATAYRRALEAIEKGTGNDDDAPLSRADVERKLRELGRRDDTSASRR